MPRHPTIEQLVDKWNQNYPKGTRVIWFFGVNARGFRETETSSKALVERRKDKDAPGGVAERAVIRIAGHIGPVPLGDIYPKRCIRCERVALSVKIRDLVLKHDAESLRTGLGVTLKFDLSRDQCECREAIEAHKLRLDMDSGRYDSEAAANIFENLKGDEVERKLRQMQDVLAKATPEQRAKMLAQARKAAGEAFKEPMPKSWAPPKTAKRRGA